MKYDYTCKSCGNMFELEYPIVSNVKSGKHEGARCAKCGSGNVQKLITTAPPVVYSGGGWGGKQDK